MNENEKQWRADGPQENPGTRSRGGVSQLRKEIPPAGGKLGSSHYHNVLIGPFQADIRFVKISKCREYTTRGHENKKAIRIYRAEAKWGAWSVNRTDQRSGRTSPGALGERCEIGTTNSMGGICEWVPPPSPGGWPYGVADSIHASGHVKRGRAAGKLRLLTWGNR